MLLSGNGRHRRPRPTPKFVVAAGVTGAGVAIPLIGATAANAASSDTWDKVAECESGGSWSVNTGNGYYGGLQLSQSTWDAYGGKDRAPRPDLASRNEQIAVAENVLAALGPTAWPSCSLTAGLTSGSPLIELPTDLTGESDQDNGQAEAQKDEYAPEPGTSDASPSATPDADPSESATAESERTEPGASDQGTQERESSPAPGASETIVVPETELIPEPVYEQTLTGATGGGGKHAGSSDEAEESDGDEDGDDDGDDGASRGPGKHRAGDEYTVGQGDTLASIAESEDVDGGWFGLYKANRDTIGDDPDAIVPGQRLTLG